MKKLSLLLLAALTFAACNRPMLTITADGNENANGYAYFGILGAEDYSDSVAICNGEFSLQLTQLDPSEIYLLNIPSIHMKEYIFAEKGHIHLDMSVDKLTGAPMAQTVSEIFESLYQVSSQGEYVVALEQLYSDHHDDLIGAIMLYYLGFEYSASDVLLFYEQASDVVRNTTFLKKAASQWQIVAATEPGKPYVDFEVEYNGQTTRLSDFIGGKNQLTIVDFWASWCGPCKREIPNLIAIYDKYHAQGVEVVGVASWDAPEATLQAINALHIPYPQIINAQSIGTSLYGIQGIPEIMLIDANGTILARGLREEAIEAAVRAHLQ